MGKSDKRLTKILEGRADSNINFSELCNLLSMLGFAQRIKGDHHVFTKNGIDEIINIQPLGSKAKPYQVKQIRSIIKHYKLEV